MDERRIACGIWPAELDDDTGLPKAELRQMLQDGLDQLKRGEGIVMDAAAWQQLRTEMRQRRARS